MSDAGTGIRATLVALSDTKLLLGYHYGEWTFGPPAIEAGIAACSMAQEEFGHTRLLNRILDREFGVEIDPLADTRPAEAFASIAFLDRPLEHWGDVVATNLAVDQAISMEIRSFDGGGYDPLARVTGKMLLEEKFHHAHAEGWVRLLEKRGGEAREAFRASLARALRDAAAFFGPPGHDEAVVADGAKRVADDALRARLLGRIARLVEEPVAVGLEPAGDGWALAEPVDFSDWDPDRRRVAGGGPLREILDELRGTKNVAFKTA